MSEVPITATAMALLDTGDENNFRRIVHRAVARALENHEGHWRSDDRRDAREIAEAACHFLMDEIKVGLESDERAREFAKSLNIMTTNPPTEGFP
jgi:hypothetical protein